MADFGYACKLTQQQVNEAGLPGSFAAPLVLPGVRPLPEADIARAGGARTPSAPGWLLTTVLAPLLGAVEYAETEGSAPMTVGIMQRYIEDYCNHHDTSVCRDIMAPHYVVHIAGRGTADR